MRGINPHIVCSLCAGYFVDATAITECLHIFCKSCIVKYLQTSKSCPQCSIKIHETQPLVHLRPDRTMQDIVFKLIPTLFEDEEKRRQTFYKSRGLGKVLKSADDENNTPQLLSVYEDPEGHYYKNDEQISICLDRTSPFKCGEYTVPCLQKKFIRCSVRTTIYHVEVLLSQKLAIPDCYKLVVTCNSKIQNRDYCLKQVWITEWYGKQTPLLLHYNVRKDVT